MTIVKEYRMLVPCGLDEYRRGQRYAVMETMRQTSGSGEGTETRINEPYEDEKTGEKGQYSYKLYKYHSKMPIYLRKLFRPEHAEFHEESWNAFPHTKTIITNPAFMKDGFECKIETWHKEFDLGETENVHSLPADQWDKVEVTKVQLDPVKAVDYLDDTDPFKTKSSKIKTLPLDADWEERCRNGTYSGKYICIYKLITIRFDWLGVSWIAEKCMHGQQERILRLGNRTLICWIDKWIELTMEEIEEMERVEFEKINQRMLESESNRPENASMSTVTNGEDERAFFTKSNLNRVD